MHDRPTEAWKRRWGPQYVTNTAQVPEQGVLWAGLHGIAEVLTAEPAHGANTQKEAVHAAWTSLTGVLINNRTRRFPQIFKDPESQYYIQNVQDIIFKLQYKEPGKRDYFWKGNTGDPNSLTVVGWQFSKVLNQ